MGARSSGREAALQMLFSIDSAGHPPAQAALHFWREMPGEVEGREYADPLVREVTGIRPELDRLIASAAQNWRLERMTPVDRNILRLATFELLHRRDVPTEVILDEAIELAKRYGADNSSKFINGVLDKLAHELRKDA